MFISIVGYFGLGFERERARRRCLRRKGLGGPVGSKLTGEIYVGESQRAVILLSEWARDRKGNTGYCGSSWLNGTSREQMGRGCPGICQGRKREEASEGPPRRRR